MAQKDEMVILYSTDVEGSGQQRHMSKVGQLLYEARFKHNGHGADIQLLINTEKHQVHSAVVAAHSLVLRDLLAERAPPLTLDLSGCGFGPEAVRKVIRFIYHGQVTVTYELVEQVLRAAAMLRIPELQKTVESFLISLCNRERPLHPIDCLNLAHEEPPLVSAATRLLIVEYIAKNFISLGYHIIFTNLRLDAVCALLDNDRLSVSHELEVFERALFWLHCNPDQIVHADRLFRVVRFGVMATDQKLNVAEQAKEAGLAVWTVVQPLLADGDWCKTCLETSCPTPRDLKTVHRVGALPPMDEDRGRHKPRTRQPMYPACCSTDSKSGEATYNRSNRSDCLEMFKTASDTVVKPVKGALLQSRSSVYALSSLRPDHAVAVQK